MLSKQASEIVLKREDTMKTWPFKNNSTCGLFAISTGAEYRTYAKSLYV